MSHFTHSRAAFCVVAVLLTFAPAAPSLAAPKEADKAKPKDGGVVAGLVTDKADNSITVQVDGEEEPTKFVAGEGTDKRSLDALKTIFTVDRVNVKYKADGNVRRLLAVEKVTGRPAGVVVGEVVKVYNDFWVAVKPKGGMIEGFALNGPAEKVKAAADVLKALKPGDVVAIKYTTDGERHRIQQIEVKPAAAQPAPPKPAPVKPGK